MELDGSAVLRKRDESHAIDYLCGEQVDRRELYGALHRLARVGDLIHGFKRRPLGPNEIRVLTEIDAAEWTQRTAGPMASPGEALSFLRLMASDNGWGEEGSDVALLPGGVLMNPHELDRIAKKHWI